jgi:hypothetical protein
MDRAEQAQEERKVARQNYAADLARSLAKMTMRAEPAPF